MTGGSLTRVAVARFTCTGVSRRGAGVTPLGGWAPGIVEPNKKPVIKPARIRKDTAANYTEGQEGLERQEGRERRERQERREGLAARCRCQPFDRYLKPEA